MHFRKKILTVIAGTACIAAMAVPSAFGEPATSITSTQVETQIAAQPGAQDESPVLAPSKQDMQPSPQADKSSDIQQTKPEPVLQSSKSETIQNAPLTADKEHQENPRIGKKSPAKKAPALKKTLTAKHIEVKPAAAPKSELSFDLQPNQTDDPNDNKELKPEQGFISKFIDATKGLIGRALSWLGTRYVWGGLSFRGVDCSGLTRLVYQKEGIKLPHSAKQQYKIGKPVNAGRILPGDLVFFNTRGPLTHVGIYIGEGKFVHAANPRRGVRIDALSNAYYKKRFAGARRYLDIG